MAIVYYCEDSLKIRRKFNWLEQLGRLVRYRLHVPMKRSRHGPAHTARGVGIGMFWAMTPTFGFQMLLVLGHWLISRKIFKWDFSLVNGVAWTWVTNIVTIIPAYYLFYATGQLMLGNFGDISGYDSFSQIWQMMMQPQTGDQSWWQIALSKWGLAIMIGWIPWAIISGLVAYRVSLNFVTRYQARRIRKMKSAKHS